MIMKRGASFAVYVACLPKYKMTSAGVASVSGRRRRREELELLDRFQRETISKTLKITDHRRMNEMPQLTQWIFYQLCDELISMYAKRQRLATCGYSKEICLIIGRLLKFIADEDGVRFGHAGGWEKGMISKAQVDAWKELRSIVLDM